MQKSAFPGCIIFILFISSCGLNRHTAQEFYNKISGINDTLDKLTTDWHDILDKAAVNKNYAALTPARIALGSYISKSRSEIASLQRTDETGKIIGREEELLETQSGMVAEVYPKFDQYTEFTPKDTVTKNLALLGSDLVNEKAGVAEVKKMLLVIAAKNDLKNVKKK